MGCQASKTRYKSRKYNTYALEQTELSLCSGVFRGFHRLLRMFCVYKAMILDRLAQVGDEICKEFALLHLERDFFLVE